MTNQEAKALSEWFRVRRGKTLKLNDKGIDCVIESLEKQIPKKPFQPFGTHSYKCSNCWKFVAHEVDDNCDLTSLAEWCPYCGQKIDWSIDND